MEDTMKKRIGEENNKPSKNQKKETNIPDVTQNRIKNLLDMNIKDVITDSSISPKLLKKLLKKAIKFKFFIKLALKRKNQKDTSIRVYWIYDYKEWKKIYYWECYLLI